VLKCEKHTSPLYRKSMRPQPPLLARASLGRPLYVAECQEPLSLPHPKAEHPLVALTREGDLFIFAKDLFVEAIATMID